ncbi:MAG TPA: hypothetical protein VKR27_05015, partial [Acidimicrobiales bacterium]|nr:hypothetical protein [Acidimicrobiales bacterium]
MTTGLASPERQKGAAADAIDAASERLVELSHEIHAHPELGFEEERASTWCADMLAGAGFSIEMGAGGLPTAFSATVGSGEPAIGICCEYDALPDIGHACGH